MKKQETAVQLTLSMLYLFLNTISTIKNSESVGMLFAHLIMTIAFFISVRYIYDRSQSLFSINNLIFLIMIGVGFFSRYYLVNLFPGLLMDFAPIPLQNNEVFHIKTSLATLIMVISFACAYNIKFFFGNSRTYQSVGESDLGKSYDFHDAINSYKAVLLFGICLLIGYGYRFNNIRSSTFLNFGTYDALFGIFTTMAKGLAYAFLVEFNRKRNIKNLLLYSAYIVPTIILAFLQAWKGAILYEALIVCIIFSEGIRKLKKRYIVLLILVAIVVFPAISMIRDNAKYATTYSINLSSVIAYNRNNNILEYYSNRLQYYDEAYYVVNTEIADIIAYRTEAKGMIARFLAGIVPRALWPNKPIVNNGSYVTYTLLHYPAVQYNNLSIGFLGDAFASYGYLGVLILSFLYAKGIKKLESIRVENKYLYSQLLYLTIGYAMFSYIEGDIVTKTISVVQTIIALLLIKLALGIRKKSK